LVSGGRICTGRGQKRDPGITRGGDRCHPFLSPHCVRQRDHRQGHWRQSHFPRPRSPSGRPYLRRPRWRCITIGNSADTIKWAIDQFRQPSRRGPANGLALSARET